MAKPLLYYSEDNNVFEPYAQSSTDAAPANPKEVPASVELLKDLISKVEVLIVQLEKDAVPPFFQKGEVLFADDGSIVETYGTQKVTTTFSNDKSIITETRVKNGKTTVQVTNVGGNPILIT